MPMSCSTDSSGSSANQSSLNPQPKTEPLEPCSKEQSTDSSHYAMIDVTHPLFHYTYYKIILSHVQPATQGQNG